MFTQRWYLWCSHKHVVGCCSVDFKSFCKLCSANCKSCSLYCNCLGFSSLPEQLYSYWASWETSMLQIIGRWPLCPGTESGCPGTMLVCTTSLWDATYWRCKECFISCLKLLLHTLNQLSPSIWEVTVLITVISYAVFNYFMYCSMIQLLMTPLKL